MSDKGIEELAKLGQKAVEAAEKTGGWVDTVFGEGLRHLGGAFADSMAGFRVRNRVSVLEKTQKRLEQAGLQGKTRPLQDRLAAPIIEAIELETDDTLQNVWAQYIARGVDPSYAEPTRVLTDVIRRLEPADWPIIEALFTKSSGSHSASDLGFETNVLEETMERLTGLALFDSDEERGYYLIVEGNGQTALPGLLVDPGNGVTYAAKPLFRKLREAVSHD